MQKQKRKGNHKIWHPSATNFIKINFDRSVFQDNSTSIGFISRDEHETLLHLGARRGSNIMEALAMRFTCLEASRRGYKSIHLKADNINVINDVLGFGVGVWKIDLLIADIRALISSF